MDEEQLELFEAEEVERRRGEGVRPDVGPEVEEPQDEWRPLTLEPVRVELLKDYRGIYGVGMRVDRELNLITRPDRVVDDWEQGRAWRDWCALQPVPRPRFCHTVEGDLVDRLHRSMAACHGQIREEYGIWRSWSEAPDPKLARQVYHGLKIKSVKIVNSLIRKALEVADQRALKAARRFPIRYRAQLYRSFCKHGERAIQLGGSFPLLAVMLFTDAWSPWGDERQKFEAVQRENIDLVLAGAKLKLISDYIGIPYTLRRVTPRATKYVRSINDEIAGYIPLATRSQRVFFSATRLAEKLGDQGFTLWAARRAAKMTKLREFADIEDIRDWVRACGPKIPPPDRTELFQRDDRRAQFITRRFSPDMSLKTVRKLCLQWHEAIANNMTEGELIKFPEPWIGGAEFGDHKIVTITDSRDLYLASKRLHNCAASEYAESITYGRACLYTVNDSGGAPVVMVELYRKFGERGWSNEVQLGQVKGYCNAPAPEEIERGVRRWFSRMKKQARLSGPANERAD
jgi:hypothetical protein